MKKGDMVLRNLCILSAHPLSSFEHIHVYLVQWS